MNDTSQGVSDNPFQAPQAHVADVELPAPEEPALNKKRLLQFTAIFFGATLLVGFSFGFLLSMFGRTGRVPPDWFFAAQMLAMPLVSIAVIAWFAARQKSRTWLHASLLVVLAWLTGLVNLPMGTPVIAWAFSLVPLAVCMVIAVPIGKLVGARKK